MTSRSLNSAEDPPVICGEEVTQVSGPDVGIAACLAFYRESDE